MVVHAVAAHIAVHVVVKLLVVCRCDRYSVGSRAIQTTNFCSYGNIVLELDPIMYYCMHILTHSPNTGT